MFRIIRPYEKGVIEFLGKYSRTVDAGMKFIMPFVEKLTKVDIREQVVDVPPQAVITKDNVVVEVDAVIYYEVVDPAKVTYNVADFYTASTKLAQTSLRNLIGDLALDESLTSREIINSKLRDILDEATNKWGVKISRVELQRIDPPEDVTEAMHRQMKAERDRRARILEAEGHREAAVLEAEGQKQSAVLGAEGKAEAIKREAEAEKYLRRTVAEGEAEATELVFKAIHAGAPSQEIIAIKYLESLKSIAEGNATKIFLPYEATGILGSLAGIAEVVGIQISPSTEDGRSKDK